MSRTRIEKCQILLPTEPERIAKTQESTSANTDEQLKKRLPLINCECGTQILVLPDLRAMNRAIKTHVTKHRKKKGSTKRSTTSSNDISQLLSQLSLIRMSQQSNN
jgi:hypothetical protein